MREVVELSWKTIILYFYLHRRNEERSQGGPGPPLRSKMGTKSCKIRSFWGVVIYENICCKTKFKSLGAEFFWAPLNLQLNCACDDDNLLIYLKEEGDFLDKNVICYLSLRLTWPIHLVCQRIPDQMDLIQHSTSLFVCSKYYI